jgi:hypothetical protein
VNFKLTMKCDVCQKVFKPVQTHRSLNKYLLLVFAKCLNKNYFPCPMESIILFLNNAKVSIRAIVFLTVKELKLQQT